jgi:osmotically-inducible protein OsmY
MSRLSDACRTTCVVLGLSALAAVSVFAQASASPSEAQLQAAVQKKVADQKLGASHLGVEVHGTVVMLSGTIPTLWQKERLIEAVRKMQGVTEVDSTLDIPPGEGDLKLSQAVLKAIKEYPLIGVYDLVNGNVNNGVVTLTGAVTEPKKNDDIVERVEKLRGVQKLDNRITVLPLSPLDERTRESIAQRIYSDPTFENYSASDPPIHIIVANGHVTLVGIVQSEVERRKAESIARMSPNVFAVDDQIHLVSEFRR